MANAIELCDDITNKLKIIDKINDNTNNILVELQQLKQKIDIIIRSKEESKTQYDREIYTIASGGKIYRDSINGKSENVIDLHIKYIRYIINTFSYKTNKYIILERRIIFANPIILTYGSIMQCDNEETIKKSCINNNIIYFVCESINEYIIYKMNLDTNEKYKIYNKEKPKLIKCNISFCNFINNKIIIGIYTKTKNIYIWTSIIILNTEGILLKEILPDSIPFHVPLRRTTTYNDIMWIIGDRYATKIILNSNNDFTVCYVKTIEEDLRKDIYNKNINSNIVLTPQTSLKYDMFSDPNLWTYGAVFDYNGEIVVTSGKISKYIFL